jgi:hypothetical protein
MSPRIRIEGYTYTAKVWALSLVQGPFYVAPYSYRGLHVHRESVGVVPRSRAILCRPVPDPIRIEGYTYTAKVWALSLVQGPFSVAPCPPSTASPTFPGDTLAPSQAPSASQVVPSQAPSVVPSPESSDSHTTNQGVGNRRCWRD